MLNKITSYAETLELSGDEYMEKALTKYREARDTTHSKHYKGILAYKTRMAADIINAK